MTHYGICCGRQLVSNAWKFCPYCGRPLRDVSAETETPNRTRLRASGESYRDLLHRSKHGDKLNRELVATRAELQQVRTDRGRLEAAGLQMAVEISDLEDQLQIASESTASAAIWGERARQSPLLGRGTLVVSVAADGADLVEELHLAQCEWVATRGRNTGERCARYAGHPGKHRYA